MFDAMSQSTAISFLTYLYHIRPIILSNESGNVFSSLRQGKMIEYSMSVLFMVLVFYILQNLDYKILVENGSGSI